MFSVVAIDSGRQLGLVDATIRRVRSGAAATNDGALGAAVALKDSDPCGLGAEGL